METEADYNSIHVHCIHNTVYTPGEYHIGYTKLSDHLLKKRVVHTHDEHGIIVHVAYKPEKVINKHRKKSPPPALRTGAMGLRATCTCILICTCMFTWLWPSTEALPPTESSIRLLSWLVPRELSASLKFSRKAQLLFLSKNMRCMHCTIIRLRHVRGVAEPKGLRIL